MISRVLALFGRRTVGAQRAAPLQTPVRVAGGEAKIWRYALPVIVIAYVALAAIFSAVTPMFEAPDENYHFAFIQRLTQSWELPVQDASVKTPWDQEGSQPPLYYLVASLVARLVPADATPYPLAKNPHAQIGIGLAQINHNVFVHTPDEAFPWHGLALRFHLVRLFSIVMGAVTVFAVHRTAQLAVRESPTVVRIVAAVFVAFNPMFLFITSSINNDNMVMLWGVLASWLMLAIIQHGYTTRRSALLAIVIALASLSKLSGLTLYVPAGAMLLLLALNKHNYTDPAGELRHAPSITWRTLVSPGTFTPETGRSPGSAVALHQPAPCAVAELHTGTLPSKLLERSLQPRQHLLFPGAARTNPAAIEIEHVHGARLAQQDVVSVQIRVLHALSVKTRHGRANRLPRLRIQLDHEVRQRLRRRQLFGDQVGPIHETAADVAGRHRRRHRQLAPAQLGEQTPFRKAASPIRAQPQILIIEQLRHQTAATIVPQHPVLPLGTDEAHRSAAARDLDMHAARHPILARKHFLCRLTQSRSVV